MVYISHRMEELNRICERATVLRDGKYIGTVYMKDITLDKLVNMIVGRPSKTSSRSMSGRSAILCLKPVTSEERTR